MNVLVAGASGFIGKNFLLKIPSQWTVTGLYNTSDTFPEFVTSNQLNHVTPVQCDLSNADQMAQTFKDNNTFDVCLFVLGNSDIGLSAREPMTDLEANTHTLLNLIQHTKIKKFIFMSSGTVYLGQNGLVDPSTPTEPLVPYGIHKLSSELYIKFFQEKTDHIDEYVILRFFGAYGPMELPRKIYTNLIHAFARDNKEEHTIMGGGKNYIDAMYIDDTIDGLLTIINSDKANVTLDFCKGEPLTINELVIEIARILGKDSIQLHHEGASNEFITFHASPQKMKQLFNFQPTTSLEQGIKTFADYLRQSWLTKIEQF